MISGKFLKSATPGLRTLIIHRNHFWIKQNGKPLSAEVISQYRIGDAQMHGTSVTVVLIGAETLKRRWVRYEIERTLALGKGLIGITLDGMKNASGVPDLTIPMLSHPAFQRKSFFSPPACPVYSWSRDNGRANISRWIEGAALGTKTNRRIAI